MKEARPKKSSMYRKILFTKISVKCKLIYSDKNQTSECIGKSGMGRGKRKLSRGDGYVQYLHCGNGFMGVYIYIKTSQTIFFKYV